MLLCSHSIAGKFPYPPKREKPMSEAKPQDGTTVKGYRTLTADDIAQAVFGTDLESFRNRSRKAYSGQQMLEEYVSFYQNL